MSVLLSCVLTLFSMGSNAHPMDVYGLDKSIKSDQNDSKNMFGRVIGITRFSKLRNHLKQLGFR